MYSDRRGKDKSHPRQNLPDKKPQTKPLRGAVHKVRHAILDQFRPPLPVTLCHTSRDPLKYVTPIGPPTFSSTCMHAYICLSSRRFLTGGLSGFFIWKVLNRGGFFRPHSVRIHPLQQNAKHHFQF